MYIKANLRLNIERNINSQDDRWLQAIEDITAALLY